MDCLSWILEALNYPSILARQVSSMDLSTNHWVLAPAYDAAINVTEVLSDKRAATVIQSSGSSPIEMRMEMYKAPKG